MKSDDPISFWRARLEGVPPVLDLPIARGRRQNQPYEAAGLAVDLAADGPPPADRLVSAVATVLARYSGQTDILVGVARSLVSRGAPGGELLPLRLDLAGGPTGGELVGRVARELAALASQPATPFAELVRALGIEPATSHHPLVQVTVGPAGESAGERTGDPTRGWVPPDLTLAVADDGRRLLVTYNARLFPERALRRLAGHLAGAYAALGDAPGASVASIELLTGDELERITRDWNRTGVDFPADVCLHHLFERRVDAAPDAVAAICGDQSLTYAELEERANRLANHLRADGVRPCHPVGLCVERSLEMVVGLMAIAKAGGAYLPLDPAYPAERLAWMLADADLDVVLTLDRLRDRLPEGGARRVRLDADWEEIAAAASARPGGGATPDDLAYVIYTSGSTGNPKGVVLDHRGRVNNFTDFNRRFAVGPDDRLIALSSLSFDMTAYDVFGVLAAGATIVMPPARLEREPIHWAHLIRKHEVTLWHSAPAMLEMLVGSVVERPDLHPRSLRLCLLGGDWIPVSLPDRLRALAGDLRVVSLGGATEVSMDSTIYEVTRTDPSWTSIPYGRPMANQLAYVLDPLSRPLPVGVPGELHLGGVGVAWGYLERPGLSAEKFVPNPFSGRPGDRMYRTGDLARWLEDGNLELLGRIDNQIKIRGHRIELGEIEATLKEHPAVREAVVVARGERGTDRRLVGYVVPEVAAGADGGSEWDREQVGEWRAVYDETYGQQTEQVDPTFNIIGWNSSYTGLPIPDEEMREWVDATVERIRSLAPQRVLEIGCGTGLMLFRVAPDCQRYVGLDLSAVGLETIRRQLGERGLDRIVVLRHQTADDLTGLAPRSFDLVVLNSITQLFPSVSYLLEVLDGAVELIRPGGFLFVGDNRNLRLGGMLHTSIQVFQAPASVPGADLPGRIAQSLAQEEQLLLDPELFRALPARLPRVSSVTVQIKRGRHHNELTRFRYDVIAAIEADAEAPPPEVVKRDWDRDELDLEALEALLAEAPARLEVRGIPNARLAADRLACRLVESGDAAPSAGAIREAVAQAPPHGAVDPEELWRLAEAKGYEAFLGDTPGAPGCLDAILRPRGVSARPPALPAGDVEPRPWASYGNQPLHGRLSLRLPGRLREFLRQRLPDYMVPATLVLLDKLPLSPNGKVDRKRLPEPEQTRPELDAPLVEARTPLEELLTAIWEETLGLDRIGVQDGFLELGGHSLLATQVQSRIHELFPVEVPLRHFFGALTIERLAETLKRAGAAAGVDIEASAELVLQYSDLSVEELESVLETESAPESGEAR
jgi:amino acid adenylation domain-containing protein